MSRGSRLLFLAFGAIIAILALVFVFWPSASDVPAVHPPVSERAQVPAAESAATQNRVATDETAIQPVAEETRAATATLVVAGVRYPLYANAGATLEEALDLLQSEGSFTYEKRTYSGLGSFVTEINGRAGDGGYYWILYVNGEKSSTGISSMRIRSGDVIEWKLEESY
jgi:hypothetical protein